MQGVGPKRLVPSNHTHSHGLLPVDNLCSLSCPCLLILCVAQPGYLFIRILYISLFWGRSTLATLCCDCLLKRKKQRPISFWMKAALKKFSHLFCLEKKKKNPCFLRGLILVCLTGLDALKEEECSVLRIVMHLVSDGCMAAYLWWVQRTSEGDKTVGPCRGSGSVVQISEACTGISFLPHALLVFEPFCAPRV